MKIFFILGATCLLINSAYSQNEVKQNILIGDHFGGGIVFYVEPNGQHGLIAAPKDQPDYACWGFECWTYANLMNDGKLNTDIIVKFMKKKKWMSRNAVPAACMCDSLKFNGYDDWYLPSINELKDMYDKQNIIGDFIAGDYCSSTESNRNDALNIHFKPNKSIIFHYSKFSNSYNVRCIRKF